MGVRRWVIGALLAVLLGSLLGGCSESLEESGEGRKSSDLPPSAPKPKASEGSSKKPVPKPIRSACQGPDLKYNLKDIEMKDKVNFMAKVPVDEEVGRHSILSPSYSSILAKAESVKEVEQVSDIIKARELFKRLHPDTLSQLTANLSVFHPLGLMTTAGNSFVSIPLRFDLGKSLLVEYKTLKKTLPREATERFKPNEEADMLNLMEQRLRLTAERLSESGLGEAGGVSSQSWATQGQSLSGLRWHLERPRRRQKRVVVVKKVAAVAVAASAIARWAAVAFAAANRVAINQLRTDTGELLEVFQAQARHAQLLQGLDLARLHNRLQDIDISQHYMLPLAKAVLKDFSAELSDIYATHKVSPKLVNRRKVSAVLQAILGRKRTKVLLGTDDAFKLIMSASTLIPVKMDSSSLMMEAKLNIPLISSDNIFVWGRPLFYGLWEREAKVFAQPRLPQFVAVRLGRQKSEPFRVFDPRLCLSQTEPIAVCYESSTSMKTTQGTCPFPPLGPNAKDCTWTYEPVTKDFFRTLRTNSGTIVATTASNYTVSRPQSLGGLRKLGGFEVRPVIHDVDVYRPKRGELWDFGLGPHSVLIGGMEGEDFEDEEPPDLPDLAFLRQLPVHFSEEEAEDAVDAHSFHRISVQLHKTHKDFAIKVAKFKAKSAGWSWDFLGLGAGLEWAGKWLMVVVLCVGLGLLCCVGVRLGRRCWSCREGHRYHAHPPGAPPVVVLR